MNKPELGHGAPVETSSRDVDLVKTNVAALLTTSSYDLGDEYFYASLPLCVLDAVFSVGIRYESVRAVVHRYCEHVGVPRLRPERSQLPSPRKQHTIAAFIAIVERQGVEAFATDVLANRCRTSTHGSSILKSDASLQFAKVLQRHEINVLQDITNRTGDTELDRDLRSIKGQSSGISVVYFFMLAGSDDLIKPDRMILRFLRRALQRPVSKSESQELLMQACKALQTSYPGLTPRSLDHVIWNHERQAARSTARS
jgi:hypothetical protein